MLTNYKNRRRRKNTSYNVFGIFSTEQNSNWSTRLNISSKYHIAHKKLTRIQTACMVGVKAKWYSKLYLDANGKTNELKFKWKSSLKTENELGKETLTTFNQNFGSKKFSPTMSLWAFIQLNFATTLSKFTCKTNFHYIIWKDAVGKKPLAFSSCSFQSISIGNCVNWRMKPV